LEKDNPKLILVAIVSLAQSVRLGLRAMLESDDQVQIAGEVATLNELSLLPRHTDVVVIASWGSSLHVIQNAIAESLPETSVLLLSNEPVSIQSIGRLAERAWGFLSMDTTQEELTAAVHALSLGLWVGDSILTGRSSRIGSPALRIGISENTVKYHISSIYSKLGATNRTEAARLGAHRGIIVL
jgi:DNA-binding NarL/FixJ family response regulator